MNLVVDASVACKWYLNEPLSEQAQALAESDDMFVASDLIIAEVGNVIWRRVRVQDISRDQAERIAWHLPGVFLALVPAGDLLQRSLEIATALDHPIYDCFYLALAERWEAPLVTADNRFFNQVRRTEWSRHVKRPDIYGEPA